MKLVKTLDINEDQMALLAMQSLGMTKEEMANATGRGLHDIETDLSWCLSGWTTQVMVPEKIQSQCIQLQPPAPDYGFALKRDVVAIVDGIGLTEKQQIVYNYLREGMTISDIANVTDMSYDAIHDAVSRIRSKFRLNGGSLNDSLRRHAQSLPVPTEAAPQNDKVRNRRFDKDIAKRTKEGLAISVFEYDLAKLYASGATSNQALADGLGVLKTTVEKSKFHLKQKLGLTSHEDFHFALRAIAEL